ncbi:HET-domain-containing protein [Lepidopterella palustris CBS 459.81]|uniref:HET-domain-containing protein n=1 Tax=Lepidopterella palustris CBS 459.81 TaxID=1314670 RepID=A0A8E2J9E5_9PEZI|nr:HET-domain-containing protein [Lepidopterella palustris CBS 459.81]
MPNIYQHLDSKLAQIRTLSILPGEFDDPIHVALQIEPLDDSPQYEALSYVWGQELAPLPAVVNGTELQITQNLDIALRHLRHPHTNRVLWVDAICIDQSNIAERADQVKLMHRIYHDASTVLIWLGPAADDSDLAMRSIAGEKFDKEYWQTYDFQIQFMEILYRPWFTRIWVIQEFVLGKNHPRIGCGTVWAHWLGFINAWLHFEDNARVIDEEYRRQYVVALSETFQTPWVQQANRKTVEREALSKDRIFQCLQNCFGEDYLRHTAHSTLSDLSLDIQVNYGLWAARYAIMQSCQYESPVAKTYWRRLELNRVVPLTYHKFLMHARGTILLQKKSMSFEEVLKGTMNLRSTDPRDKIYGILGLVSDKARESIPIDYCQAPEWTFVPTMAYIIRHEPSGVSLLGLLWAKRPFKTRFPSWVADFTISADYTDKHSPVLLRGSCVNSSWRWPQDNNVTQDLTTLSASGISFGTVKAVVPFVNGDRQTFVMQLRAIETLVKRVCPLSEPLWRTLIGARNTDPNLLNSGLSFDQRFEVLMGRSGSYDQLEPALPFADQLREFMGYIMNGRSFFVTDEGFAGVSTPEIQVGDTVAIVFGMIRPTVLREVTPDELGIKTGLEGEGIRHHRITGFAYVGCHNREEFEAQEKEGFQDWTKHQCFRNKEVVKFSIL